MYTGQATVLSLPVCEHMCMCSVFLYTCIHVSMSLVCLRLVNEDIRNIRAGTMPSGHGRGSRPSSFNVGIRHSLGSGKDDKAGTIKSP